MIEEAAGTRLYESKRENAEKTIEKKESKLREVDSVSCVQYSIFLSVAHCELDVGTAAVDPFGIQYGDIYFNRIPSIIIYCIKI